MQQPNQWWKRNKSYPPSLQRLHRSVLGGSNIEGIQIHHLILIAADHATARGRCSLHVTTSVHDWPAAREMAPPVFNGATSRFFTGITNRETPKEKTKTCLQNQPEVFPARRFRSLLLEIPNIEFPLIYTIYNRIDRVRILFFSFFFLSKNQKKRNQNQLYRELSIDFRLLNNRSQPNRK